MKAKSNGDFTVKRLRATAATFPKLLAKAAQTRHLARYVLKLVREQADDSDWDQTILCVVELLVRFYEILHENSQFLSDGAKAEMAEIGQSLAEQYSILAKWSFDWKSKLFKMSPKLHMWEHLTEFQAAVLMNPRFFWCHADEDLVGLMVEVAHSCHPATLGVSILFKWLHLIFDTGDCE